MVWVKNNLVLRRHKKFRKLARILSPMAGKAGLCVADGVLSLLWKFAYRGAPDGDLSKFSHEEIAKAAGWELDANALVDALVMAGFLDKDGDSLRLHDWADYSGRLIEQRRNKTLRLKEYLRTHNGVWAKTPEKATETHQVPEGQTDTEPVTAVM